MKTIRIEVAKCEVGETRKIGEEIRESSEEFGGGKISSIWFQTHLALCLHSCFTFAKRRSVFRSVFFFLLLRLTYVSPDPYLSRDRRKVSRGNFDSSERITFFNYFPDSERRREIYCLFENSLFSVKPKHRSKFERSNRLGSLTLKF